MASIASNLPVYDAQDLTSDQFFEITLLVSDINPNRVEWTKLMKTELGRIGIGVKYIDIADQLNNSRFYANSSNIIPTYDEGGYDTVFLGLGAEPFFYQDANKFIEGNFSVPPNFTGYGNRSTDKVFQSYLYDDLTLSERNQLVPQMQNILYQDLPIIPIFNYQYLFAYDNNLNINHAQLDVLADSKRSHSASPPIWEELSVSKSDKTLNIACRFTNFFTPFFEFPRYSPLSQMIPAVFQPLYFRNYTSNYNWQPLLAQSMPTWNTNKTIATVKLRNDVVFADGVPFNASDVVETYHMFLTPGFASPDLYYPLINMFSSNASISAIDEYTVQFKFNKLTPFMYDYLSFGIVPTHTYGTNIHPAIKPAEYYYDIQIANDTMTNGSSNLGFGTGPFVYSTVSNDTDMGFLDNVVDGNVSLTKNPNYWHGTVPLDQINFLKYVDTESSIQDVISNKIDLIWGDPFTNKTYAETQTGFNSYYSTYADIQFIGVNMNHPILGSGINTPLGKEHPENAAYAARMIRKAISHVIPRTKIVNEIQFGNAVPAATPIAPNVLGWSNDYPVHQYDPHYALELMKLAGYDNSTNTNNLTGKTKNSSTKEGPILGVVQFMLMILFVIQYKKISKNQN